MNKGLAIMTAALLLAACMTPGRKREKANAESAVSEASASVAAARQAGGEIYAGARMRLADNDLRTAQKKLKSGDWEEALRRARMAAGTAGEVREEAQAARKREKAAGTVAAPKPVQAEKKLKPKTPR